MCILYSYRGLWRWPICLCSLSCFLCLELIFFFFSSRRRHTRSDRDWSSDVCSSDLLEKHHADLLTAYAKQQERMVETEKGTKDGNVIQFPKGAGATGKGASTEGTSRVPSPPPPEFFEDLAWRVNDDERLQRLCQEIHDIRFDVTPIAAALILRALLEYSLIYQLKSKKLFSTFQKAQGKNQGLDNLLNYCKEKKNGVFKEQNIYRHLEGFLSSKFKDKLDFAAHNKYGDITPGLLRDMRTYCRPIIEHIVHKEEDAWR